MPGNEGSGTSPCLGRVGFPQSRGPSQAAAHLRGAGSETGEDAGPGLHGAPEAAPQFSPGRGTSSGGLQLCSETPVSFRGSESWKTMLGGLRRSH